MKKMGLNRSVLASVVATAIAYGTPAPAAVDAGVVAPSRTAAGTSPTAAPARPTTATSGDAGSDAPPVPAAGALDAGLSDAAVGQMEAGPQAKVRRPDSHRRSSSTSTTPPPTAEQLESLRVLKSSEESYERGARDYREAITTVVTLHFEEKKKAILAALDKDIDVEKGELRRARESAIKRLEDFVAKYSGANSQAEATPDAMFRLAALYEERARSSDTPSEDLAATLKPAIALYKRILREFPEYKSRPSIYFFLGHALNDSLRVPEAQQVWRSLVCHNHYTYPTAPDAKSPEVDTILPMAQDDTEDAWKRWRSKYPVPESLKKGPPSETHFNDPYPQDCIALTPPNITVGEEPPYLAETWWEIGNWEFDQGDLAGGAVDYEPFAVWDYNRAAAAYQQALHFKKPPVYGVALYKYAWTLFKQQRYQAATEQFVSLLLYTDEQQRLTGDPGADFRSEAFTYIAGSLMNIDFVGPSADEPYIAREDIIATESRPGVAEQKLRVAFDRVQDSRTIPQDKPWTIEIYRALAIEFRTVNHFQSALLVYQKMLENWPMDPSAPETQNSVAETYDLLARGTRVGPEREGYEAEVLKARTALAKYTGTSPWVDANKDNPSALARAEELVRTGLKSAAIVHTRNGMAAIDALEAASDPKEQLRLLNWALGEYRLAAIGWDGYLKQDENAPDAYRSRYFRADALHQQVTLELLLHKSGPSLYPEPTADEIAAATAAAADVRDSDEDDQFIDNAAIFVVDLSDVGRDLAFQRYGETGGSQGIAPRKEPPIEGQGEETKVVSQAIPELVMASMKAREDYLQRVPADKDKLGNSLKYSVYSAEQYYLYGHFKEARERYEPLYRDHCGKDEWGYESWKRLITMSNLERDSERSRQLAEAEKAKSCALSDVQKGDSKMLVDPTIQGAAYLDARKRFTEAQKAADGPARNKLWRQAASMYEAALTAAPGRDDAAEAAMNSAYAYKQVGQFNDAIRMYNLFIEKYGSDENMNRLQFGGADPVNPKAKVGPNPAKYKERLKYLADAYDALSSTYYGFFNYAQAAQSYAKIASNTRFDDSRRQGAARIAMILYANLGDRANMVNQYGVLTDAKLHLPLDRRAEADFLKANFDYTQWNPEGGDAGGNGATARQAIGSLAQYHTLNRNRPEAARYVVEAAYKVAKMMKASGDPTYRAWLKTTTLDWEYFRAHPFESELPDGRKITVRAEQAPYNDYAAEADFTLVDETIRSEFDYETGHHRYTGNIVDVNKEYLKDFEMAEGRYRPQLDHIAQTYKSFEWAAASVARAGSLYDSLRTALELVVPKYFTPQQDALLKKLDDLGQMDKADEIRDQVKTKWRESKDTYLDAAGQKMVNRYVQSALIARANNTKNGAVQHAIARLAALTDYLGNEKLKGYVEQTNDPTDTNPDPSAQRKLSYTNDMFLQWRSGAVAAPPPSGMPLPGPVKP